MVPTDYIYARSPGFIQNILLNLKAVELFFERYGKKFWSQLKEFEQIQWMQENEIADYQNRKLRDLVKHAFEYVPYYQKVMKASKLKPEDINGQNDLYKLPVLTKNDIRRNFKDMISRGYSGFRLRHGHTSGTTGSPLNLCYDIKTCVVHHAADWRQKIWAGLNYGKPYASIQGRVIVPIDQKNPPFWRKNYINNQLFLSSFHLKEENLQYYFDELEKRKIKFLEGYPSTIYILAMYLNSIKMLFPMKAILTSSETLFDFQREAIEKAFQCKVFDFYGMAERVVFATECEQHSGHHLNSDYGITEFLDKDNNPIKKGRLGKIIATSLHNFAMPMIRYQTNDSCALKKENCACGRGFPLMEDVTTKNESIVTLPDGRLISPSVLTHPFKPMHNILESQIIQEKLDYILIKIVKKNKYNNSDEKRLLDAFLERVGEQVKIDIEYVNKIPRTKGGKYKWVMSAIEPKF